MAGAVMNLRRLIPLLLAFASSIPICGQVRQPHEVDSLLKAASKALDHWQQLAPEISCEDAAQTELRKACKISVQTMGERVQEAEVEIARYRQRSAPEVLDLFNAYESFRRVMEAVEDMNCAPDFYGEHNRAVFAEAYNNFVKVTGWFGNVVRDSIRDSTTVRHAP
jgi:hypothetical protein